MKGGTGKHAKGPEGINSVGLGSSDRRGQEGWGDWESQDHGPAESPASHKEERGRPRTGSSEIWMGEGTHQTGRQRDCRPGGQGRHRDSGPRTSTNYKGGLKQAWKRKRKAERRVMGAGSLSGTETTTHNTEPGKAIYNPSGTKLTIQCIPTAGNAEEIRKQAGT